MGLLEALKFPWGKKEATVTPQLAQALMYAPQAYKSARNFRTYAVGYGENVYLFRAIDYLSTAIAGVKLQLYTDDTKKKKIDSHEFIDLLKKPHDGSSQVELMKELVSLTVLSGNGYLYPIRAGAGSKAKSLYVLRPDQVDVTTNTYGVINYAYTNYGTRQTLTTPDMMHLKMFNPTDQLIGLSPVAVAAALIDQFNAGTEWGLSMLQNGGRPSGALITQAVLGDTSYRELKKQVEETISGPQNAGRPLLLDSGLDWKQFSLNPLEMDWLNSKVAIAREIALAIGVPPILVGDTSASTYSNYQEARLSFFIETVLPFLDLLMSKINAWLPALYPGESLYLDYDKDDIEALQEDRNTTVSRTNDQFNAGYMTANEARIATGLDEMPGFDFVIMDAGKRVQAKDVQEYTKLPDPNAAPAINGPQGPNGGPTGGKQPNLPQQPGSGPNNDQGANQGQDNAPQQPQQQGKGYNIKALNLSTEEKGLYWQNFEAKREGWYGKTEDTFKAYFKAEGDRVVKALMKAAMPETVHLHVDKALNDTTELTKAIAHTYTGVGYDFGNATYKAIKQRVKPKKKEFNRQVFNDHNTTVEVNPHNQVQDGNSFDLWSSLVVDWLKNDAGTRIVKINDTTRNEVRARLAEGVANGESIYELADRIRGLYDEYYKNRSVVIARTEVINASNKGAISGALQTGLPLKKEWISTRDARTREAHVEADGQTVNQHDPFIVGGEKLMHPGDAENGASAANTIQCRCTVGFIYDEANDPDPLSDLPPQKSNIEAVGIDSYRLLREDMKRLAKRTAKKIEGARG